MRRGCWQSCNCRCWRRKKPRRPIATTHDTRHPDSESEAERADTPCQAHLIGVAGDQGMRPLCVRSCPDEAKAGTVRLLLEDAQVSDLTLPSEGPATVNLCNHHQQLYGATLTGRKCSNLTCYHITNIPTHVCTM